MVNSWSLLYDEMYGPDDEVGLGTHSSSRWEELYDKVDADFVMPTEEQQKESLDAHNFS